MASREQTILQFAPSPTSLSAKVQPLVIFNICDYFVRRPDQVERVISTLLGSVLPDGTVDIRNSYAIPHNESSHQVALDIDYHHNMLASHQKFMQRGTQRVEKIKKVEEEVIPDGNFPSSSTPKKCVSVLPSFGLSEESFPTAKAMWGKMAQDGNFDRDNFNAGPSMPSSPGETRCAAVSASAWVEPHGKCTVAFALAWSSPKVKFCKGKSYHRRYTKYYGTSERAASKLVHDALTSREDSYRQYFQN